MTRPSATRGLDYPRRFRRRLTLVFVLTAAVAAGLVAVSSWVLVRNYRTGAWLQRAERQANLALRMASMSGESTPLEELVDLVSRPEGYDVIARRDGATAASWSGLHVGEFEEILPPPAREGAIVERTVAGEPYLIAGGRVPEGRTELYLVFSQQPLLDGLHDLAAILTGTGAAVVVLAGLVGGWVARRTLDPVHDAAQAASAVADGLLDTRLPVRGEDEFAVWAHAFNEMAAALSEKIQALSDAHDRERRFTSNVAHELRTPLSALVSSASLLAEHLEALPGPAQRPAALLIEGVGRLRRLLLDLLELARMDAGQAAAAVEAVELTDVIDSVIRTNGWEADVRCRLPDVCVAGDRRRVERIVFNLVANAVEHGRVDVEVRTRRDGSDGVLEVHDRGRGIPAVDLSRIFDRFYKSDRARSGGGSGLGLAIAQENARLMGTEVAVTSRPENGTCFSFRLPLWDGTPNVPKPTAEEPADALVVHSKPRNFRSTLRGH